MDCDDILAYMKAEFEKNKDAISWIKMRQLANGNRIETLKLIRCDSSVEWLNFIKSSKMMMNFV